MSFETDLQTGIAELLAAAGIARWQPSGAYPKDSTPAIFVRAMPETPDALVSIASYPVAAATDPDDSVIGVQVRTRCAGGDPRPCDDLDDAIYAVLHGLANTEIGGHFITKSLLQSGASLGQDGAGRWSRSANYYITLPRPLRAR